MPVYSAAWLAPPFVSARVVWFDLTSRSLFFIVEHMSREILGNFELMVMLALIRLGDAAYGVPISKTIEESTHHEVLVGSVYAALERLEVKGFVGVRSW